MCGRFVASTPPAELAEEFEAVLTAEVTGEQDPGPRFNVAPTLPVYAVATSRRTGERRLGLLRWGLVPWWADDVSLGNRLINARVETLRSKRAFRDAALKRRCLIPADAFYEWSHHGGRRQPFAIVRRDGHRLAFAGLWEGWRPPGQDEAPLLRSCTIITTRANEAVAPLHDRMPAMVPADAWEEWLDPDNDDWDDLRPLLEPPDAGLFRIYAVSTEVNNVRHEGAQLLEPDPAGSEPHLF